MVYIFVKSLIKLILCRICADKILFFNFIIPASFLGAFIIINRITVIIKLTEN